MASDLQALLAAIVADPSDDVARLVYADCLEEHGNAARAQFIRLQIEAECHHPDSNVRAELEQQAYALFADHWIEWWGEVCAAVGFPPVDTGCYCLGRSTAIGFVRPEATQEWTDLGEVEELGRSEIAFRRGFPEAVTASHLMGDFAKICAVLARWRLVSPLAELTIVGSLDLQPGGWPEGTHLSGVRNLTFEAYDSGTLHAALRSPNVTRLESLKLANGHSIRPWIHPDDLAALVASPHADRLVRLDIPVSYDRAAEVIASALPRLESLGVDCSYYSAGGLLTSLANSPRLARIRHLSVRKGIDLSGFGSVIHGPAWMRLRSLEIECTPRSGPLTAFSSPSGLPELEECRLAGLRFDSETVEQLVRSPLLKRLRHFALSGGQYEDGHVFLPLVDAVDSERIETFAIQIPYFPERAANALRAKFGGRVRFLPV